jgi:hypothetical protein
MKKRWMWVGLLAVGLFVLLGASLAAAAARGALGSPGGPAAAPLGHAFTYQGQLIRGTTPVSETCQMAFRLYDAGDDGLQVGDTITTSVAVVDGLFTVPLDFGAGAFPGQARWLDIAVKCPADPAFVAFPERQALTPAPYALYATTAGQAESAPWDGLTGVPAGFADGVDDVDDADADPGNELNQALALVDNTLVLTDTGTVSADLSALQVRRLVDEFVMHSGESVSAGDLVTWMDGEAYGPAPRWGEESIFDQTPPGSIAVAVLSPTDFVVAYSDQNNNYYGMAITGSLTGGSLAWGSPEAFHEGPTFDIAAVALSGTEIVITYRAQDEFPPSGTAIAGALTGGGFFWGSPSVFNAGSTNDIATVALSASDFVVAYSDGENSNWGTAIRGTLASGSLTWGDESVFHTGATSGVAMAALSPTDLVVAYVDGANFNRGTAITGTLSGGDLTWGDASLFNPGGTSHLAIAALSETDVIVAYQDGGDSYRGMAIAGTLGAGELAWGDEIPFNEGAAASQSSVVPLSATAFVIAYQESENGYRGTAVIGELDGGEVAWINRAVFNASYTVDIVVAPLPATEFVIAYADVGNAGAGTARVPDRMARRVIGIAAGAATGGEPVTVITGGVADGYAGLTPGRTYYWQGDGSLGTTWTPVRVGLALSESELLLDQLWTQ